nr:unnamed protein product [Trichobilharzia regenti]
MRYFLLFITSFILLHVQQSTQNRFIPTDIAEMKQCFQNKTKKYEEMAKTYDRTACRRHDPNALRREIHQLTNQIRTLYYVIEAQTQSV